MNQKPRRIQYKIYQYYFLAHNKIKVKIQILVKVLIYKAFLKI